MEDLVNITYLIDDNMYAFVIVGLLLICGIYFTIRTRFVQIRRIPDMLKYVVDKNNDKSHKTLSSFQALMVSTGSRVGTGNIAGIATAVAMGGPGAIFWMWILAIIGAASAFVESTLAQIWKKKGPNGSFIGGPAFYIEQALGKRWLGCIFAVTLILAFGFGLNSLQTFNAVSALDYYFQDSNMDIQMIKIGIGIIIMFITAITIFGGSKSIGRISSIIVPFMAFIYIGIAITTIVLNFDLMPKVFKIITFNAFHIRSVLSGAAGSALLYGTKRGLLSNEAGMGSAPNAAACANVSHPVKQGLIQSLSAYIDTFFICTSSAFLVMVYVAQYPKGSLHYNGMEFVQMALQNSIGEVGIHFLTIAVFFFAFSSIIGNYCYAENNFDFIHSSRKALQIFRCFCLLPIIFGCVITLDLAWNIADICVGLMAIINIFAIMFLGKWAIAALKDFEKQRKAGKDPVFKASNIKDIPKTDCW